MENVDVNLLAVLVCGLASMVLGGLWYSMLFGKAWMKHMGWTMADMEKKKDGMAARYSVAFLGALLTAYVLAHFVQYMMIVDNITFTDAMKPTLKTLLAVGAETGFWTWLGFVATISLGSVLWEGKKFSFYLINAAYYLVQLVGFGMILAAWKA